jgi:hypothetical protein
MSDAPEAVILDTFRAAWRDRYGYVCSVLVSPLQFMELSQHADAHGAELLCRAIAAYFETEDQFPRKARHPLGLWLKDPLRYLAIEPVKRRSECPHMPPCERSTECTRRIINDGRRARGVPLLEAEQ